MAVHIRLTQFDGPLDLLLHLIGKAKIELKDIFVSEITQQYIDIVSSAEDFDMDEGSEFIAMAATLVEIKSRAMLPKPRPDDEEDPEQALIQRLEEYQRFKESAKQMALFEQSAREVFGKLPEEYPLPPPTLEIDGLTLQALWEALWRVAQRKPKESSEVEYRARDIRRDSHTVEGSMARIEDRLKLGACFFLDVLSTQPDREEVVTLFIALLELMKLGKAHIEQSELFNEIKLCPGRKKIDAEPIPDGNAP